MKKSIFVGHNALGDTLCTTPVVRAFRRANPDTFILYITQSAQYCRVLDGNPDIDLVLYSDQMLYRGLKDCSPDWLNTLPIDIDGTTNVYRLDLKLACTSTEVFERHISQAFSDLVKIPIDSVRPVLCLSNQERRAARHYIRRPTVVFSMSSVSNPERNDGTALRKKNWPQERWLELAERVASWGDFDVVATGAERDLRVRTPYWRNLYGLPIKILAGLMEASACVVTLENGVAHLAAAVDAPTVQIYSDLVPLGWALPDNVTRWKHFYGDPYELSVDSVADAVEQTLQGGRL